MNKTESRMDKLRRGLLEPYFAAPLRVKLEFIIGLILVLFFVCMAVFAPYVAPKDPLRIDVTRALQPPSAENLFGTDILGRDLFSRIIFGTRVSLYIALLSVVLSAIFGGLVGIISGYLGGLTDRIIGIPVDAIYAFPAMFLALTVVLVMKPTITNIAVAVAFIWLPYYFKITRSITIQVKERTFIEAEKAIGAGAFHIATRHIAIRTLGSISVLMALGAGRAVITTAALGFLGFGLPPPTPEWGTELAYGRTVMLAGHWWNSVFPGITLTILVFGLLMLGEGLNSIISPAKEMAPIQ